MIIGLEAISFHTTQHYIELSDLAEARSIAPEKFTLGLGQQQMSIACLPEDTVHLAINAAKKALERFNIAPEEIGMLVVGTESGVDHSKPVAVYVHQALGLPSNCISYETKHACFGAMAAISAAGDWLISGRANNRKALIIAADIANYALHSAAEPTQGAGAVAMVISDQPTLVHFDRNVAGHFTNNVMDFWRPLYAKEALTDGHYSIECYLDALTHTLTDAKPELPRLSDLQACLYHVPFVKMASKAHQRHFEYDQDLKLEKASNDWLNFEQSYQTKTLPWLDYNARVGNIYTGSLFLSLMALLVNGNLTPDQLISLFSYGSGSAAALRLIRPIAGYEQFKNCIDPSLELDGRTRLSISQYEEIMQQRDQPITENDRIDPADWGLTTPYLYSGNQAHIRQYSDFL
jgi:hydroxymethylglutaryl-CoA synthase